MATVAELVARLSADSTNFSATMRRATGEVATLEGSSRSFGQVATVAWAAAGIAAVKATADFVKFESTMTRLKTLAGASQAEVDRMTDSVLNMAGAVGKSPQELAEGLYYVESAGLKGADALETLEYAAKASALGMGTVEEVADATTSVLNAYGTENISAAEATGILREAVEQSKREADEMAGALGRVLPIASEMGVEFDQVAGAVAAMTRTGLDASEAVTALRGIMVGILDPTDKAEETLRRYGYSVEELQNQIRSGDLVGVLLRLKESFKGNDRALAEVFGNVRALVGALNLVGENADAARAAFDEVTHASAGLDDEWEDLSKTTGQTLAEAWASLQSAMIRAAEGFAPILKVVADILKMASPLLTFLDEALYAFLAFKALVGISMIMDTFGAKLAGVGVSAYKATGQITAAQTAMMKNWTPPSLFKMDTTLSKISTKLRGMAAFAGPSLVIGFAEAAAVMDTFSISIDKVAKQTHYSAGFLTALDNEIAASDNHFTGFISKIDGTRDSMEAFASQTSPLLGDVAALGGSVKGAEQVFENWAAAAKGTGDELDGTQASIDNFIDAQTEMIDDVTASGKALGQGQMSYEDYMAVLDHFGFAHKDAVAMAKQALDDYGLALDKTERVVVRWGSHTKEEIAKFMADFSKSIDSATGDINSFDRKWQFTGHTLARTFDQMRIKAGEFRDDMEEFKDADWIPQRFQEYLAKAGPDAIHGFVGETDTAQREMVADWKSMDDANKDSKGLMDDITSATTTFTRELNRIPKRVPITFDLDAAISPALAAFLRDRNLAYLDTSGPHDASPGGGGPHPGDNTNDTFAPIDRDRTAHRSGGSDTVTRDNTQQIRITNWNEGMGEIDRRTQEQIDDYARNG